MCVLIAADTGSIRRLAAYLLSVHSAKSMVERAGAATDSAQLRTSVDGCRALCKKHEGISEVIAQLMVLSQVSAARLAVHCCLACMCKWAHCLLASCRARAL